MSAKASRHEVITALSRAKDASVDNEVGFGLMPRGLPTLLTKP